jgi:hypothetical protein
MEDLKIKEFGQRTIMEQQSKEQLIDDLIAIMAEREVLQERYNAQEKATAEALSSAKDWLIWLRKTATDDVDNARLIGYEDCLKEWQALAHMAKE